MPTSITKHPGGRPTKYDIQVIGKIEEYLNTTGREQTSLPSIEGLAEYLGFNKTTLYEWAEKYPEFSNALKRVEERQKLQLMNDGMYGGKEVNASMAIFLLKALHGLKDQPTSLTQINVGGEMTLEFTG